MNEELYEKLLDKTFPKVKAHIKEDTKWLKTALTDMIRCTHLRNTSCGKIAANRYILLLVKHVDETKGSDTYSEIHTRIESLPSAPAELEKHFDGNCFLYRANGRYYSAEQVNKALRGIKNCQIATTCEGHLVMKNRARWACAVPLNIDSPPIWA